LRRRAAEKPGKGGPEQTAAFADANEAMLELTLIEGISMKFAWIQAGSFLMGSPDSETDRLDNEIQHKVIISKPFHLGICEVTQKQYMAVMGNNPSEFKRGGGANGERRPVEKVSWREAGEFCLKASELTGRRLRLPSEAEWEYACRAGTVTQFNTGETLSSKQANHVGDFTLEQLKEMNENRDQAAKLFDGKMTSPVGSYPPNAWGLYDMHGNVFEWCADWYGEYGRARQKDPRGPDDGTLRVVRGGSWYTYPEFCRSAYRSSMPPERRYSDFGFRAALD
jgi:formylglycine-generating enzyme required for sulfatase activity